MTTLTTAIAALTAVGQTYFASLSSDPTYGNMYAQARWVNAWLPDTFNWPTIALYEMGGNTESQGLGFVSEWRYSRLRLDVFMGTPEYARQAFEALRAIWITDFDTTPSVNVAGQGYLRLTGGIKNLNISESRALSWEKSQVQYRRNADVLIEIGD
jgi:hypothetical protein